LGKIPILTNKYFSDGLKKPTSCDLFVYQRDERSIFLMNFQNIPTSEGSILPPPNNLAALVRETWGGMPPTKLKDGHAQTSHLSLSCAVSIKWHMVFPNQIIPHNFTV